MCAGDHAEEEGEDQAEETHVLVVTKERVRFCAQATMLKKMKGKMKRRNTDPFTLPSPVNTVALQATEENSSENNEF